MIRRFFSVVAAAMILCTSLFAYAATISVPSAVKIPDGAYGVWQVPSINTSTPLYRESAERSQQMNIDAENSAHFRRYGIGWLICDHAGSEVGAGIWHVENIRVGDSAFLITETETTEYYCYLVEEVDFTPQCFLLDGVAQYPHRETDIICASCSTRPKIEYLAFFKLIGWWG